MPDRVVAVEVGTVSWVRIAPVATAVHTATEVPESTQLMDKVLRESQSRTWQNERTQILRVIGSKCIGDRRWPLHKGYRSCDTAFIATIVAEIGGCCCSGGCCGGGCRTVGSAVGALNNIGSCRCILIDGLIVSSRIFYKLGLECLTPPTMDPTRLCGSALGRKRETVWFWAMLKATRDNREKVREIIFAVVV